MICKECKKEFKSYNKKAKYCSSVCYNKSRIGKKFNKTRRANISKSLIGYKHNDDFKEKARNRQLGVKRTEKSRKKLSESLKKAHKKKKWGFGTKETWNKGMIGFMSGIPRHAYDDDFKKKISDSSKGRIPWNLGLKKYSYEEQRKIKNKYQSNYRRTIGKLKNKIYRVKRRFLNKKFIHSFTEKQWIEKLEDTKGICNLCNKYAGIEKLTLDHIIPLTKAKDGHIYDINGVQPLCSSCNSKKGNR